MNTKASNLNFGDKMREIRKQKGYTLSKLAEISGISKRMIGHYETQVKRPSIDKIKKIAEALNVSIDDLMGTTQTEKQKNQEKLSYSIMKRVKVIESLPKRDRDTIFSLINALAEKNKLKKND